VTTPVGSLPAVSVVLVNFDGAEHLPDCLDSLGAQDYPPDRLEVIVVDNGSTDGSLEMLAAHYPGVRVLPQGRNTGFAPAVSEGVRAATGDCVALLNNDMRADPGWVRSLVEAYDPANGVVCVAGQILSWDGEEIDFVEGTVNFYGMGNQVAFGRRRDDVEVRDGTELLFACGGSMLVGRDVYLDTGGFDAGFFAYFEDIDFGWRLNLFGYNVRLAAGARSYHRLHGTSSRFPDHQRMFLYERNSLRLIMKNYGDGLLPRVLAPACLLTAKRAAVRAPLDGAPYRIGGDREPTEEVPRLALAHLHALISISDELDDLLAKRAAVQRRRCRTDDELSHLFVRPMQPVPDERSYVEVQSRLVSLFELDRAFARERATRVVALGAGSPRVRAMAGALDDLVSVEVVEDPSQYKRAAEAADLVLLDATSAAPELDSFVGLVVADLPDPATGVAPDVLDIADLFTCRTPADADRWAKAIVARGREEPVVAVVADGLAPDGWRRTVDPLRDVVRRPWEVRSRRPRRWTEDAQLVLEQQRRQMADLAAVVAAQEAKLARIRRLPGYRVLRAGLRLLQQARRATGRRH
jgi:GT2 family glycosyltransferase